MPPKSQKGKDSATSRAPKAAKNNEGEKVERHIGERKREHRTKKGSEVVGVNPAEPSRHSERTQGKRQCLDNPSEDETSDYYSASNQEDSDAESKATDEGRMEVVNEELAGQENLIPASASTSSPSPFDTLKRNTAVRVLDQTNTHSLQDLPTTPIHSRSRPSMFIPGSFHQDEFATPRPQRLGTLSTVGPSIEVPLVSMVNGTPMILMPDETQAPVTPDNIIKRRSPSALLLTPQQLIEVAVWASEAEKYRKERDRLAAAQTSPSGTTQSAQIEEIVSDKLIDSLNPDHQPSPTPDPENNGSRADGSLDNGSPSLPQTPKSPTAATNDPSPASPNMSNPENKETMSGATNENPSSDTNPSNDANPSSNMNPDQPHENIATEPQTSTILGVRASTSVYPDDDDDDTKPTTVTRFPPDWPWMLEGWTKDDIKNNLSTKTFERWSKPIEGSAKGVLFLMGTNGESYQPPMVDGNPVPPETVIRWGRKALLAETGKLVEITPAGGLIQASNPNPIPLFLVSRLNDTEVEFLNRRALGVKNGISFGFLKWDLTPSSFAFSIDNLVRMTPGTEDCAVVHEAVVSAWTDRETKVFDFLTTKSEQWVPADDTNSLRSWLERNISVRAYLRGQQVVYNVYCTPPTHDEKRYKAWVELVRTKSTIEYEVGPLQVASAKETRALAKGKLSKQDRQNPIRLGCVWCLSTDIPSECCPIVLYPFWMGTGPTTVALDVAGLSGGVGPSSGALVNRGRGGANLNRSGGHGSKRGRGN
ncbi:hypothetical protein PQX77_009255 [Marasmius sp. AFHP31]|nr:hypothetical protein PQX77_009255 [Marasmius sp. AFHP31]